MRVLFLPNIGGRKEGEFGGMPGLLGPEERLRRRRNVWGSLDGCGL